MSRRISAIVLAFLLLPLLASAQTPTEWSQRVAYEMQISLDTESHQYAGFQRLTYTNNSPDTLEVVYYHLYFNAFQPNSMMAERNRELPDPDSRVVPRIFNYTPDEIGFHRVHSLTQEGEELDYDITDTVLRAELAEPIMPGETTVFEMRWDAQVPLQTRRSGWMNEEGIEYSMTQWYPKIAEYDLRGWHADPYVGREFYAPFGTFDVRITAPAEYILGGTGVVQNPQEVGYGYGGTAKDMPGTPGAETLTWHFQAEDVHDFAWAADPDYIHDVIHGDDGHTYHLLYQPDVAEQWQPMRQWTPAIIQYFSQRVGEYPWPQFTVAQGGDGGMEYPMITLITGDRSPRSLFGVTAHEAAHMWFYGIVANNEADYAWMDEGFASFLDTEAAGAILQGSDENVSHLGSSLGYLYMQDNGLFERVQTPADWFLTNSAYGVAAYSTGDMFISTLGYVIGDAQRDRWLRELYDRFKFRHPDPFDLERVAEDISGLRLDWYFEQFLNSTRALDYAIDDVDATPEGENWLTQIELEREAEIVMPIDLRITYTDSTVQWVNIPLGIMQGHKPVPDSWIVADPWLWTSPDYTLELTLPKRVDAVAIDPQGRMPDRNRLDNTSYFPLRARFLQPPGQTYFEYSLGLHPIGQYADLFGFGGGLDAEGSYLFGDHYMRAMLKVWPQVLLSEDGSDPEISPEHALCGFAGCFPPVLPEPETSRLDGIDYALQYSNEIPLLGNETRLGISLEKQLGLLENRLSVTAPLSSPLSDYSASLSASILHQYNPTSRVFRFQETGFVNPFGQVHLVSFGLEMRFENGDDIVALEGEIGTGSMETRGLYPINSTNDLFVELNAVKSLMMGPIDGEAAFRVGVGSDLLAHKHFRLGGASFEDQWRNAAFRSIASAFADPLGDAHLVALRGAGPVAYLRSEGSFIPVPDPDYVSPLAAPSGSFILGGRLRLRTPHITASPWLRPLQAGIFSGAGYVSEDGFGGFPNEIIADAGLEVAYDVSELSPLQPWIDQSQVLQGLSVVGKFPIWASDPDIIDPGQGNFALRWLIGIETGI